MNTSLFSWFYYEILENKLSTFFIPHHIDKEIAKTREKITEYQNRLRGLEAQKTEAENLQIVQLVRSMRLSPHELSAMLSGGGIPGMEAAPGYPAEPADHDTEEMEDTENE